MLPYGQLARAAPVAVIGFALSGLIASAFYALVPAWMQDKGTARETIALFMVVAVLGGLAFQIPVGRLSDRFDRRLVLAALGLGFAVAAVALIPSAALLVGGPAGRSVARRFYVDPVPGLRRQRTRPHAGRSGRGGERPAHPGERARLGRGPADRHEPDGALRHRRRILLYGRRRSPLGPRSPNPGAPPSQDRPARHSGRGGVGLGLGPSEAEPSWSAFLKGLLKRGLGDVKLVISDAYDGLRHAITRCSVRHGATWQRCRVHWMRNALAHGPKGQHTMVAAAIHQTFLQTDAEAAHQTWRHVADQLRPRWPKLAALTDDSEHDVLAYNLPGPAHRTKLHSANPLERLNKEVRRRADVVGVFPNEASITRSSAAMQIEGMAELTPPPVPPSRSIATTARSSAG